MKEYVGFAGNRLKSHMISPLVYKLFTALVVISFMWYALSGLQVIMISATIGNNTHLVSQDDTKVKVEYIMQDGTLKLTDGSSVDSDDVTEYIRVKEGSGVYYIPDGKMSAEITSEDTLNVGLEFLLTWLFIVVVELVYTRLREVRGNGRVWDLAVLSLLVSIVGILATVFYQTDMINTETFIIPYACNIMIVMNISISALYMLYCRTRV